MFFKKIFHKILELGIKDSVPLNFHELTLMQMRKDPDLSEYRLGGYRVRNTLSFDEYIKYTFNGLMVICFFPFMFVIIFPIELFFIVQKKIGVLKRNQ